MSSLSKYKSDSSAGGNFIPRPSKPAIFFSFGDRGKVLGECALCERTVFSARSKTCKFHGAAYDHLRSRHSSDRAAFLVELARVKAINIAHKAEEKGVA